MLMDRYVTFSFVRAFVIALFVFSMSGVMLDYFSRVGYFSSPEMVAQTFAETYSHAKLVFLFYLAYLPYLLKQVLPFVAVAAALLTVGHMLRLNEVTPILAAGVSPP